MTKDFLSKFPDFFFAHFFVFPYFPFFYFPSSGMRSLPNMLPSVKFPNFEMFPAFPAFPVFLEKIRGKNGKKNDYRRTFGLNFQIFFRAICCISVFSFFSPNIGMRSLPNISPSLKFPNFGKFPVFLGKKKIGKTGESCSVRTAL